MKVIQNSGDFVAFNEKESVSYVSAIEGNYTLIDEVIYNFMFKFCHDDVCQHWRSTHAYTIGLFIQLVVARKDGFRACVADKFGKCRFLEFGFDKLLILESI